LFLQRFKSEKYTAKQPVFQEGERGETLYIVQSGLVSLHKHITGDIDKKLFSARPGTIFGEFSFMDRGERSATAMADDDSVLLSLNRDEFYTFIQDNPKAGAKLFRNLLGIVVERLRRTNEAYRDAVRWGLEITGTQKINFHYLITENVEIRLELLNGKTFEGKVLQLEKSDAGHELILVNKLGKLAIIPYHAILSVTLTQ
ncbi:MAG: cyclic nucleotide-binding domain-containing protein, partial [Desulfobacterales bacterium]